MWFGSTTIGSLVGSIAKTATSGLQELLGMATSAIGANVAKNQAVSTAEDIAAAVRREITSGINPDAVRETLQSSLASLPIPHLNLDEIRGQFEKILNTADLQELADTDLFRNFDRQQFLTLIRDRTKFIARRPRSHR